MQTPIILLVMEASTLIAQHCNTYVWWRQVIDLDPPYVNALVWAHDTLVLCTCTYDTCLPLTTIAIYNHLSLNKGPSIVYITNP